MRSVISEGNLFKQSSAKYTNEGEVMDSGKLTKKIKYIK